MPTSAEWKLEGLLDAFLKLDGIDGRREQAKLTDAYLKIDSVFSDLANAPSDVFVKLEHKYDHTFDVIGQGFQKVGHDFSEIASAALKIDQFTVKLTNSPTTAAAEGAPDPQQDFLKLDAVLMTTGSDLKIVGADFLKVNESANLELADLKIKIVSDDFNKVSADMAANHDAFMQLGDDFIKLANVENPTPLDFAYKEFGGELHKVAAQFDALKTDFLKISFDTALISGVGSDAALTETGGGGSGAGMLGGDLMTLNQHFLQLDAGLGALGGAAGAVLSDLFHKGGAGST